MAPVFEDGFVLFEQLVQVLFGIAGKAAPERMVMGAGHHGPDVFAQLCQRWGQTPAVILVTAERDATLRRQAAERGWGFLAKPVRPPALRALVSQTLLRWQQGKP